MSDQHFRKLIDLVGGCASVRVIQLAVTSGLLSFLADQERCDETALVSGVPTAQSMQPHARSQFLNGVAALDLIRKDYTDGQWWYSLSEFGRLYFDPSSPSYFGWMVHYQSHVWSLWTELEESLCSPTSQSDRRGQLQTKLVDDPQFAKCYVEAMHAISTVRGDTKAVAKSIDLSHHSKLLDLGCGPASFTTAFLQRNPKLEALCYDLPHALDVARHYVEIADLSKRCSFIEGDFLHDDSLTDVTFDAVFLSNIIHNESTETNRALLERLHTKLPNEGILIIKDHLLDPSLTRPTDGALFSLEVMLHSGGRCYAMVEVVDWLEAIGFADHEIIPPQPPMTSTVLVARKKATS